MKAFYLQSRAHTQGDAMALVHLCLIFAGKMKANPEPRD